MHFERYHGQGMHKLIKSLSSDVHNTWATYETIYYGHVPTQNIYHTLFPLKEVDLWPRGGHFIVKLTPRADKVCYPYITCHI